MQHDRRASLNTAGLLWHLQLPRTAAASIITALPARQHWLPSGRQSPTQVYKKGLQEGFTRRVYKKGLQEGFATLVYSVARTINSPTASLEHVSGES
jgi:hypothetical protein